MATNPAEVCRVIFARDGKLESIAESSADENSGHALIDNRLHGIAWITARKRRSLHPLRVGSSLILNLRAITEASIDEGVRLQRLSRL